MMTVRYRRQGFLRPWGGHAAVVVLAALASGCKTGGWTAKPSWWGSTGAGGAGSSLTAAPSFDADPTKPSEVAKPYPTTGTPEGYALDAAASPAAGQATAAATVEPAAVTYGTTVAARTEQPERSFQPTPPSATAGVGPQVGPYASLQQPAAATAAPSDPAAAAMAGFAAAPSFEPEPPPAAPTIDQSPGFPGTRVADARASSTWPGTPAAADPVAGTAIQPAPVADGRYGQTTGSRFSSSGFQPPSQASAPPGPGASEADPFSPAPPAAAAPPVAAPPAAAVPPALPGGVPPPTRRPDPGYRPGGTSSYRPNRAILADDESAGGPIQPVAYDLPASGR